MTNAFTFYKLTELDFTNATEILQTPPIIGISNVLLIQDCERQLNVDRTRSSARKHAEISAKEQALYR
jgi:hypothetical protein